MMQHQTVTSLLKEPNSLADKKAGEQVLGLMDDLRKADALLTRQAKDPFESGLGIFVDIGPWTIPTGQKNSRI